MIDFISGHSDPASKYRFGVTGIAFLIPHRIRATSKPTVPIMNGKMVIVGPRTPPPKRKDAFVSMILPFELSAWLSILAVALCFLVLWLLTACALARECSVRTLLQVIVGEHNPELRPRPERMGDNNDWSSLQEKLPAIK